MAADSSAQGFDYLLQFGLAGEAILGGIKRELGLEGFEDLRGGSRWADFSV